MLTADIPQSIRWSLVLLGQVEQGIVFFTGMQNILKSVERCLYKNIPHGRTYFYYSTLVFLSQHHCPHWDPLFTMETVKNTRVPFVYFQKQDYAQHQLWRIYAFYFKKQLFEVEIFQSRISILAVPWSSDSLDWQTSLATFSNWNRCGILESIQSVLQNLILFFSSKNSQPHIWGGWSYKRSWF